MTRIRILGLALLIGAFGPQTGHAAAVFQNLNFEDPTQIPSDPNPLDRVPIVGIMPGWTAYFGENSFDTVNFNKNALSSADVALFDQPQSIFGWPIIEGHYTALLRSGRDLIFTGEPESVSLAQAGFVEFDIKSIQMKIRSNAPFSVSLDSQRIDMVILDVQPTYTHYSGDVSGFAGQEAELRITSELYFAPEIGGYGIMFLDDIVFSPIPVPEPTTWALIGFGGLIAVSMLRRRR